MTDLLYTDIEDALRDSVRSTLKRRLNHEDVAKLYDEPLDADSPTGGALWKELASEVGVAGLMIPEELGGAGTGAREAAVVLEELGRAVAPVPFLTSSVIATTALLEVEADELLRSVADGSSVAVLVLPWSRRRGAWEAVTGSVRPVAGALGADIFLAPVPTEEGLVLVAHRADEVQVKPITSFDMSRPLAEVVLPETGGEILAPGPRVRDAVDAALGAGAALMASEQLGLMQECLENTVEYAKMRVQFARPIGSFQALKHRFADMYTELVHAHAAARNAAASLAEKDPERELAAAVAQAYCSDAAVHVAEEALQLHGGIGMTWEHSSHVLLKRAKSDQLALGTAQRHRADLAELVDLRLMADAPGQQRPAGITVTDMTQKETTHV